MSKSKTFGIVFHYDALVYYHDDYGYQRASGKVVMNNNGNWFPSLASCLKLLDDQYKEQKTVNAHSRSTTDSGEGL